VIALFWIVAKNQNKAIRPYSMASIFWNTFKNSERSVAFRRWALIY